MPGFHAMCVGLGAAMIIPFAILGAAIRPLEGWSAYCTGKAGLHMLTRAVHLEMAEKGIRVFGFQPGTTPIILNNNNMGDECNIKLRSLWNINLIH